MASETTKAKVKQAAEKVRQAVTAAKKKTK